MRVYDGCCSGNGLKHEHWPVQEDTVMGPVFHTIYFYKLKTLKIDEHDARRQGGPNRHRRNRSGSGHVQCDVNVSKAFNAGDTSIKMCAVDWISKTLYTCCIWSICLHVSEWERGGNEEKGNTCI